MSNCHEYKARGSAQGVAAAALAGACRRTLTLTGTLFGGYASTLFYLLWRFSPAVLTEFAYGDETSWVARYGVIERITRRERDEYTEDGRHSKRRAFVTRTVEKPGVSPAVLDHLIGNTVFLRLTDVATDLPSYTERVVLCQLDRESAGDLPSQADAYARLSRELRSAVAAALAAGSKRLLAAYLQGLLSYPDGCTQSETVVDPADDTVIAHAPALPADRLYPKERALIDLVRRERQRGRRVLVYISHTETRDVSARLRVLLDRERFETVVLKAATVPPDRREEWVAARVREGAEVLICHPRLVQTGLDLIDWPTIVFYEPEYSVYVVRQASRRSWRIGQRQPVEVHHFAYEDTLQADALMLVSAKTRSSLMVEGEMPQDGLAALEDDGDALVALACRLAEPDDHADASLGMTVARAQAESYRNDDWITVWLTEDASVPADQAQPGGPSGHPPAAETVSCPAGSAEGASEAGDEKVVEWSQLWRLVRRPVQRRQVASEQLSLFGD